MPSMHHTFAQINMIGASVYCPMLVQHSSILISSNLKTAWAALLPSFCCKKHQSLDARSISFLFPSLVSVFLFPQLCRSVPCRAAHVASWLGPQSLERITLPCSLTSRRGH